MANGWDRREPGVDARATDAQELDSRPTAEAREGETTRGPASHTSDDASRQPGKARAGGGSFLRKLAWAGLVLGLAGLIGLGGGVAYYAAQLPPLDQLTVPKRPPNIAILASDGSFLANRGETGGREVALGELPPALPQAFVAIEDRRFYAHWGIDLMGLARAAYRNLAHDGGLQGGSTLTQQLAKNLFLT
ncbi:MAG: transglycosylase domain-containing protein, partial [Phenylobacterium sp.]